MAPARCGRRSPSHQPCAEIASYEGADREKRLIEGAKRERELTFYSSLPIEDISVLAAAFSKKYGVKVKVWRADLEALLRRVVDEAKAKRFEVDVVAGSSSALEPLYREQLLEGVNSPYIADLLAEAIPKHRQWMPIYLNTFVQAYNTNLVKKESLPENYQELLRSEWKGKLGIEAEDFDWFAQVVMELGEAQGLRLFRDIVATNGIAVRKGHGLLNSQVASGEIALALTIYIATAEQTKRKDAPLDWFLMPPTIARPSARRRRPQCAPSACRDPVLRLHDRRGAINPGEPPLRAGEHENRNLAQPQPAQAHRRGPDDGPGEKVAGALSENDHQQAAVEFVGARLQTPETKLVLGRWRAATTR